MVSSQTRRACCSVQYSSITNEQGNLEKEFERARASSCPAYLTRRTVPHSPEVPFFPAIAIGPQAGLCGVIVGLELFRACGAQLSTAQFCPLPIATARQKKLQWVLYVCSFIGPKSPS